MSSQYCLFYEKYALDFADQYLKWLQITYILFVNTENRMSLRVQGVAQWESCAASFFSIPANILLLGKSLNCLYLSQFLTDFHFLKKHLNASVLPQFWSTHLTSSFNFKFFKTGRANSHCALVIPSRLKLVLWRLNVLSSWIMSGWYLYYRYLGGKDWSISSPRLSLIMTSSNVPAFTASWRLRDIINKIVSSQSAFFDDLTNSIGLAWQFWISCRATARIWLEEQGSPLGKLVE